MFIGIYSESQVSFYRTIGPLVHVLSQPDLKITLSFHSNMNFLSLYEFFYSHWCAFDSGKSALGMVCFCSQMIPRTNTCIFKNDHYIN